MTDQTSEGVSDALTLEDHEADVSDGGIINTPREDWPEGWTYVEGESTPPTNEVGKANLAWLAEQQGRNR